MGHADGVKTGRLQSLHLPIGSVIIFRRPDGAVVVVDAGSPELDCLPVHPQAIFAVHGKGPDAENAFGRIHKGLILF